MKNFDYLQDIEALKDLYGFCSAAEDAQQTNYDMCALNGRRALEWERPLSKRVSLRILLKRNWVRKWECKGLKFAV